MTLLPTTWNPMRQLSRFDPVSDLEEVFRGFGMRPLPRDYQHTLNMRMDVTEDDNSYFVTVDIPGVKKEAIDVAIEGNNVTISAEVKHEKTSENHKEVHSERFSGKAYRAFSLPTEVDSQHSVARYDGGVLVLTLRKKSNGESRHLSIN